VAVLATLGSQSFAPQTRTIPFSVAADTTRIRVSFTHSDWPESGPVLQVDLQWDGIPMGRFTTGGGVIRDKAGNLTGGAIVTTIEVAKPPGLTSGVAEILVLQTFISAIMVESF
jgi:hypothetical protein